MSKLYNKDCNVNNISTSALAFIGDCVFELFVRESIVISSDAPVKNLHDTSTSQVCCKSQAEFVKILLPILTEKELNIYKRGRNINPKHTPKNANMADYHSATGLETLFGYLYLNDEIERLRYLFTYKNN